MTDADLRELVERLTGHTPGPWTFEMDQDEWPDHALIGGDGDPVLSFDFDLGFRVNGANSRLIAAAPDLLAALTAVLDRIAALETLLDAAQDDFTAYQVGYRDGWNAAIEAAREELTGCSPAAAVILKSLRKGEKT